MKKINKLLFIIILISNSSIGQNLYLNLQGTDSITGKEIIIQYKDGFKQSEIFNKNKFKKVKLKHIKESDLNYILLKISSDTLYLKDDSEYKMPNTDIKLGADLNELINDTLNVYLDTYPFKHKESYFVVNQFSLNDNLPDYLDIIIIHIDNDAFMLRWPTFKKDKYSTYFSNLIKDEFCKCMSSKEVNQANIQESFQSCLEEPMTKIIPLMDTTLKNYISTEDKRDYETRVTEFINETLYKLNIYYNENCLKK